MEEKNRKIQLRRIKLRTPKVKDTPQLEPRVEDEQEESPEAYQESMREKLAEIFEDRKEADDRKSTTPSKRKPTTRKKNTTAAKSVGDSVSEVKKQTRERFRTSRPVYMEELTLKQWRIALERVYGDHRTYKEVAIAAGTTEAYYKKCRQNPVFIDAVNQMEAELVAQMRFRKEYLVKLYMDCINDLKIGNNYSLLATFMRDLGRITGFLDDSNKNGGKAWDFRNNQPMSTGQDAAARVDEQFESLAAAAIDLRNKLNEQNEE